MNDDYVVLCYNTKYDDLFAVGENYGLRNAKNEPNYIYFYARYTTDIELP
jgi:hypothetical protein